MFPKKYIYIKFKRIFVTHIIISVSLSEWTVVAFSSSPSSSLQVLFNTH